MNIYTVLRTEFDPSHVWHSAVVVARNTKHAQEVAGLEDDDKFEINFMGVAKDGSQACVVLSSYDD